MSKSYDVETKVAIAFTKNPYLFPEKNIPRSTARYWIKSAKHRPTKSSMEIEIAQLTEDLEHFKEELNIAQKSFDLLKKTIDAFGISFDQMKVSKAEDKMKILEAIENARDVIKVRTCLEIIGFSNSRYQRWKNRQKRCCLDDYSHCPKQRRHQLTIQEKKVMKNLFFDEKLSHMSLASLCLFAKRNKLLFCSEQTWRVQIKKNRWEKKKVKIYPNRKRVGVRASNPNEIWHMDITQFNLPDNTKLFLQVIIDNKSRYVLAWFLRRTKTAQNTKKLIQTALKEAHRLGKLNIPNIYVDEGSENTNRTVERLIDQNKITRTIAQIEVSHSNSMVEAFFRVLKNKHVYYQNIQKKKDLEKHINFFIDQHNHHVPLAALKGAKPIETFTGLWNDKEREKLNKDIAKAIRKRAKINSQLECVGSLAKFSP